MQNYTTTFTVDQSPEAVFAAINRVGDWWSEDLEGRTDQLGAEFNFHADDLHHTTQRITELEPGKKVVWHVVDSHINYVEDKSEWENTDIIFEINRKGGRTELRFQHAGLVPDIECYGECSVAWNFFIRRSLFNLITTGEGEPHRKTPAEAQAAEV